MATLPFGVSFRSVSSIFSVRIIWHDGQMDVNYQLLGLVAHHHHPVRGILCSPNPLAAVSTSNRMLFIYLVLLFLLQRKLLTRL